MGNVRALHGVPREFKYFVEDEVLGLIVGRGLRRRLLTYLDREGVGVQVNDCREVRGALLKSKETLKSTITLRDYQYGIPEQIIEHEEGIIRADTGAGKTILALKVIELLGRTALIIVPTIDILNQFRRDAEKYFKNCRIGVIGGGTETVGDITIATIQTLQRRTYGRSDLFSQNTFGVIICDEVHKAPSKQFKKTIEFFNAKYLYGATGTNDRIDGRKEAIEFIVGPVIVDLELPQETPVVRIIPFTGKIQMTFEYAEIIQSQVENEERNLLIADEACKSVQEGHRTLVLTKRISAYEALAFTIQTLNPALKVLTLSSDMKKKDRDELMNALRKGEKEYDIICATMPLAATGLDIPSLSCVLFAGDLKSHILSRQASGRSLRILEGKKNPLIIDIWDVGNPILKNQGQARQKKYKEWGWI